MILRKPLALKSGIRSELNPATEFVHALGLGFDSSFAIEKLGRAIVGFYPTTHQQISYTGVNVTALTFYNSASFITANRIARYDFTYTGDNLTGEALKIYDTNGTTILRTYTWTHVYTSGDLTSSSVVIT